MKKLHELVGNKNAYDSYIPFAWHPAGIDYFLKELGFINIVDNLSKGDKSDFETLLEGMEMASRKAIYEYLIKLETELVKLKALRE